MAVTAAQRLSDGSHANWKCFPDPYVIQRIDSRDRKRSRQQNHHSHSYNPTPHQLPEEPVQSPATAQSAISHKLTHTSRPARSRSRLQKRPSQRALKKSASVPTMPHSASHSQEPLDQGAITALPQLEDQAIPERRSSLRRKPVEGHADQTKSRREPPEERRSAPPTQGLLSIRPKPSSADNNGRPDSDSELSSSSGSVQSPTNPLRTPRHQPLAANDPFPLNPAYHIPTSSFSDGGNNESAYLASERSKHVLLPPGFKLGKTDHTYVEELMMPAVTHEVIKHNKTEIVQEEITREIHVHHYYTFTQPVRTVEILPARHFIVDAQTGEKVEIPPPEGWVMPNNLQPHKPDISSLATETRHYLVNQEHPAGIPEPAPPHAKHQDSQPGLKKKLSMTARWTPFPKV